MSQLTLNARPRVLGDVIPGGAVRDVSLVLGGAGLIGVAAQIVVPLSFTPVPLTLQTLAVLLVGASLGTVRGFAALSVYAAVGIAGVPWFAHGGHGFGGASFGYVLGFWLSALVVGRLAERGATLSTWRTAGTMLAGNAVIYAVGVPWLMATAHVGLARGLALGLTPFLLGDAIKLAVASGLLPSAWKLTGRR
ncbi:MAG: biotin transporter BioY [Actinomycetota bacterium]|nr:biotin transporter BioY [Actinomycetota bacterium]